MKTKKTSKTNTRSRIIFFAIALTYNLLLGLYLKDFLVLSPILLTFYLLSALPALFLLIDVRSTSLRAVIFVILGLILLMNSAYTLNCRTGSSDKRPTTIHQSLAKLIALEFGYDERWIMTGEKPSA